MKKCLLAAIIFSLLMIPVFSAYNSWGIPDSSEIRAKLVENWFENDLENIRNNLQEIYINSAGQKFQVRLEEAENTYNIFVSPAAEINVKIISDKETRTQKTEVFPGDNPGSWVLIKDKKTNKPIRIRYYFKPNSEVYIQFSPHNRTAFADMVIFDNYVSRSIPCGVPFELFYKASFEDVLNVTKSILPWNYVITDKSDYQSILQMSAIIKENLPSIMYAPDAMYDENDKVVRITNGKPFEAVVAENQKQNLYLSSAGFIKWIADGLIEPIAGSSLKRDPLIKETVEVKENGYQGVLSTKYNLFFALDWIRNLSRAVISVYTEKNYVYNQADVDVCINPFSGSISEKGIVNNVSFVNDSGYKMEVLKSLLYLLAASEPDTFYFGAIRGTDRSVSPEIKAFNECVAFFPYFDSNGLFNCFVFMNGRAIKLEDFCLLYQDDFVYLTRVRSAEEFYPYSIK